MDRALDRPIIFIGNGRSGTSIVFEVFSVHEDLGWLSNYTQSFPGFTGLNTAVRLFDNRFFFLRGEKKQHQKIYFMNRFLPRPTEAYTFWERYAGSKFSGEYLLDTEATKDEKERIRRIASKILLYQGKKRLAFKLTGPSRITFLKSIFPDAFFIHLVRDGRAVVNSLLNVSFWKEKGGLERPFWRNGFRKKYEDIWVASGKDPVVLAALQWRNIIEIAREESRELEAGHYHELRYEDFLEDPHKHLTSLYQRVDLSDSPRARAYLDRRAGLQNMNYKFKRDFKPETLEKVDRIVRAVQL